MNTGNNKQGGFYQFPLCLLAQPIPFQELLDQCFDWGVVHFLDRTSGATWRNGTAKKRDEAMRSARAVMKFSGGSASGIISRFNTVQRFTDEWQRAHHQKTAFVRFRASDLYFEVRNRQIISERDWRVLAGVYSALGDKPMVTIGWQRIQCRAAGWLTRPKSGAMPCGTLYPRGQIERSLRELLDRGYLFGATYRRGERWWSNRLNHQELRREIEQRKLRAAKAALRRKVDILGDCRIGLALAKEGVLLKSV